VDWSTESKTGSEHWRMLALVEDLYLLIGAADFVCPWNSPRYISVYKSKINLYGIYSLDEYIYETEF